MNCSVATVRKHRDPPRFCRYWIGAGEEEEDVQREEKRRRVS